MTDDERAMEAESLLEDIDFEGLNEWENNFVTDMEARIKKYGSRTFVSDKQLETLRKIAEK